MKRITAIITVIIVFTFIFTGCGSSNNNPTNTDTKAAEATNTASTDKTADGTASEKAKEPVTLMYLSNVIDYPKYVNEINDALHKAYPNITIEIDHIADNYDAALKTKLATGEGPDLFNYGGYLAMKPFVEGGRVLDLTNDKLDELIFDNFKASTRYNDKVYAIPTQVLGYGLIYNKTAFTDAGIAEPPKTLKELKEDCDKLKKVGITPFASGFKDNWLSYHMFWALQGATLDDFQKFYDDMTSGKATTNNEKLDKAFELLDIYITNSGDKPLSSDFANMCHLVGTKKAAMAMQGVWSYAEATKLDPKVELGMAPFPISDDPNDATMIADVDGFIYVNAATKYPEEAKNFIRWMLSKEGTEATVGKIMKQISPSKANPQIELSLLSADVNQWIKDGMKTRGIMTNFWPSGLGDIIGADIQKYISKGLTKDQLFTDIDANWKKLSGSK